MYKKLALGILTLLITVNCQIPVRAGQVWDKIEKTGIIKAGARKDAKPFVYLNDKDQWVGYSLELLELIRQQAEKELGKPIKLELIEVTPQNRFAKIQDQSIDLECASTTFTWKREKEVDFSLSYFASGTQMLIPKDSDLVNIPSLAGKRIGVISKTTNEEVLKKLKPQATLVILQDHQEGLVKLQKGEIDGFASDGILLEGLRRSADRPDRWQIFPGDPYILQSYACILPQDDSRWRDLVNYTIFKFIEGIVNGDPKVVSIYDRWFGDRGVNPYSKEVINNYFLGILDSFEWILDN